MVTDYTARQRTLPIEEERGVEGFGDPQYEKRDELEIEVRIVIYKFFQAQRASNELSELSMTQDWYGNTLHVNGKFRPRDLATQLIELFARRLQNNDTQVR